MRPRIPLTIALLALSSFAGGSERGDALRDFRRAFGRSRQPEAVQEQRAAALEAIGTVDSLEAAEALLAGYLQLEREVLPLEEKREKYLRRGARDKTREKRADLDPLRELQDGIAARLVAQREPDAVERLVVEGLVDGDLPLSLRLTLVSRSSEVEGIALRIDKALGKARKPADRLTALWAGARPGVAEEVELSPVIATLQNRRPALREAAVELLEHSSSPRAIEPLITRLEGERGRTKQKVAHALEVLTRQRIGTSAAAWRRWLAEEGQPYTEGEIELGGGEPLGARTPEGGARYYGIVVDGASVLFLVDRSRSMNARLGGKDSEPGPDNPTRFEAAKTELIRTLGLLTPSQRFGIMTFAGSLHLFGDEPMPATEENVARAQQWVRDLEMELGTRLYDALDLAFRSAGWVPEDRYYDATVDTLFVLTDGQPIISGKADRKPRILDAVKRFNLRRRVVIHTIGLGQQIPKLFLRRLAEENGGTFVHEGG